MTDSGPRRRASPAASPLDDDDLLREILLRLTPQPSSLPRASLVSKRWRDLASDPGFLLRFRAHHGEPPVFGLFDKSGREASFSPALAPPDRIPPERLSLRLEGIDWRLLGCRHGRVLVINWTRVWDLELFVCSPVTGARCRIALPPGFDRIGDIHGAVLCAAGDGDQGHAHGCCHSSPFKVVLVYCTDRPVARVYSSQTGVWGNPIFSVQPCFGNVGNVGTLIPSTLAGNALYWWLGDLDQSGDSMLEFRLDGESLSVIKRPPVTNFYNGRCVQTKDGGLGFAMLSYPNFQVWGRELDYHGDAAWVLRKTGHLHEMLEPGPRMDGAWVVILGYSEDADAIFLSVDDDAYMVQLCTMQSNKLPGTYLGTVYHPFTNFCSPGTFSSPSTAAAIEPPKQ